MPYRWLYFSKERQRIDACRIIAQQGRPTIVIFHTTANCPHGFTRESKFISHLLQRSALGTSLCNGPIAFCEWLFHRCL